MIVVYQLIEMLDQENHVISKSSGLLVLFSYNKLMNIAY